MSFALTSGARVPHRTLQPKTPAQTANNTSWIDFTDASVLWGVGRVGDVPVGSDGAFVAYAVSKDTGLTRGQENPAYLGRALYRGTNLVATYLTNRINGHSVGRFDATAFASMTEYDLANSYASQATQQRYLFSIASGGTYVLALRVNSARADSGTPQSNDTITNNEASSEQYMLACFEAASVITLQALGVDASGILIGTLAANVAAGAAVVVSVRWGVAGSSLFQMRINGGSWLQMTTPGTLQDTNWRFGAGSGTLEFDLAHGATFNAALSDNDIKSVEQYFGQQLGIAIA